MLVQLSTSSTVNYLMCLGLEDQKCDRTGGNCFLEQCGTVGQPSTYRHVTPNFLHKKNKHPFEQKRTVWEESMQCFTSLWEKAEVPNQSFITFHMEGADDIHERTQNGFQFTWKRTSTPSTQLGCSTKSICRCSR